MNNFEFCTPTRVIFGKDTQLQVGKIIKEYGFKKVLVHYGSGSVKQSGLLNQVTDSLETEGISFVSLGGVRPNPSLSLVREGIELCLKEKVDFILAVGGGSVIDSGKCIADGAANPDIDVWKFFTKEEELKKALPHGNILTLAASGSEMSNSCVISNDDGGFKRGCNSQLHRPLFAICNPELTYSVSKFQTACGTVDIMMHTLERYLTPDTDTPLTDRIAEGLIKTVMEAGMIADQEPDNYEARAALMWSGSVSHNNMTGIGRTFFMQVHQLEHELSGMYPNVAHGAGLSALFCSWARYIYKENVSRFAQLATRVWGMDMNFENPEATALAGIDAFEDYFRRLEIPVSLLELDVDEEKLEEMAQKCTFFGKRTLPGIKELGKQEILDIYRMALR